MAKRSPRFGPSWSFGSLSFHNLFSWIISLRTSDASPISVIVALHGANFRKDPPLTLPHRLVPSLRASSPFTIDAIETEGTVHYLPLFVAFKE
ncbi:hypothetical protein Bca4012_039741 [Brassica carinata]